MKIPLFPHTTYFFHKGIIEKGYVYPKVYLEESKLFDKTKLRVVTSLRRINDTDGMYYYQLFIQQFEIDHLSQENGISVIARLYNLLLDDIYKYQLFGVIDPTRTDAEGYPIWILDENQDSEQERMFIQYAQLKGEEENANQNRTS